MDYVKFEPAKTELCKKGEDDEFYLFNNEYILVNKQDGYILPTRREIKENKIMIKTKDCIASYENKNCYTGLVQSEARTKKLEFIHLREYIENVQDENKFQIASRASMLKDFRDKNQVCSKCGSKVIFPIHREDRVITCTKCHQAIWPTNSPAVIVSVVKEDKILLARNRHRSPGEYGVISGFLDLGETFEDAAKREVLEEVGLKIRDIKYFGSQPWAFPNSMMTGFVAQHLSGEIVADPVEILDAKWFTREQVRKVYRPSRSIGSQLIENFLGF